MRANPHWYCWDGWPISLYMHAIETANTVLLLGSALILAGILSSLIATRFGVPMLLLFLGVGMLAGEDGTAGLAFSDYPCCPTAAC